MLARSAQQEGIMGFGEAIGTCLRKFVTFHGRARRSEYWFFVLFATLAGIAAGVVDQALPGTTQGAGPVTGLLNLVLFLPQLAVTVRRLHDSNRSGWVLLVLLVVIAGAVAGFATSLAILFDPTMLEMEKSSAFFGALAAAVIFLVPFIYLLVQMVRGGTHGPNRYGPDPKAAAAA